MPLTSNLQMNIELKDPYLTGAALVDIHITSTRKNNWNLGQVLLTVAERMQLIAVNAVY